MRLNYRILLVPHFAHGLTTYPRFLTTTTDEFSENGGERNGCVYMCVGWCWMCLCTTWCMRGCTRNNFMHCLAPASCVSKAAGCVTFSHIPFAHTRLYTSCQDARLNTSRTYLKSSRSLSRVPDLLHAPPGLFCFMPCYNYVGSKDFLHADSTIILGSLFLLS